VIISQPALFCLEATWLRIIGRRQPLNHPAAVAVPGQRLAAEAKPAAMPLAAGADPAPDAVSATAGPGAPLTAAERRARAAALRALALSRGRRFAAAETAFAEAASLDPELDLTRTPAFWKLERAAHEAAINAYVQVGRDRDAAVLRAQVRSTFRPKPLRTHPNAALTP
jgi:hypothetical protein